MIFNEKVDELRQDYKFYIRCKRAVYEKPKLVKQINEIIKKIESDIEFSLRYEKFLNSATNQRDK